MKPWKDLSLWQTLVVGVWALLWLLLALTFVIPGLGDNPAYDRPRYIVGGIFVVITLLGFAGHAWWAQRPSSGRFGRGRRPEAVPVRPSSLPGAASAASSLDKPKVKTGADLPTILVARKKADLTKNGSNAPGTARTPLPTVVPSKPLDASPTSE